MYTVKIVACVLGSLLLLTRGVYSAKDVAVAFSAGMTNTAHLAYRDRVIYDRVFVNVGNGYNNRNGVFTCPTAGIYIFHFHAYETNTDVAMWLELLHNDAVTVSVSGYNSHASGGNTIMLRLGRGDRVEVRARDQQRFSLFGLPDQIYSTFTGYMVIPSSRTQMDPSIVG